MSIGELINQGLEKSGMNQSDLARKLNISRVQVSKWVLGVNFPTADKLVKVIKILNLKNDFFPASCGDVMNYKTLVQANMALMEKVNTLEERVVSLEKQQLKPDPTEGLYTYEDVAMMSDKSVRSIKMIEKDGGIKAKFKAAKKRFTKKEVERFLLGV